MSSRSSKAGPSQASSAPDAPAGGAKKPWGGRFSEATDPTVERFSASIHFDRVLARHDIRGSKAQARMLGEAGHRPRGVGRARRGPRADRRRDRGRGPSPSTPPSKTSI
ncbi:MAG: hypothetical protein R3E53_12435 [Myxococcota bacterium]